MIWHRVISEAVYRADIVIVVGSLDEIRRYLRHRFPNDPDSTSVERASGGVLERTVTTRRGNYTEWFLWLPRFSGRPAEVATVVHECAHLAMKILRNRGVWLSEDSEEAYAYYIDRIFQIVMGYLRTYRLKGRNG